MYLDEELYPYHVVLTDEVFKVRKDMYMWCVEQWGQPQNLNKDSNWIYFGAGNGNIFKFRNESDRSWFILRWSLHVSRL